MIRLPLKAAALSDVSQGRRNRLRQLFVESVPGGDRCPSRPTLALDRACPAGRKLHRDNRIALPLGYTLTQMLPFLGGRSARKQERSGHKEYQR